jgi:hypothetical protein
MTPNKDSIDPKSEPQVVSINGFKQVLEMLKAADPAFRESLLKRLAAKDRDLANSLRRDLLDSR